MISRVRSWHLYQRANEQERKKVLFDIASSLPYRCYCCCCYRRPPLDSTFIVVVVVWMVNKSEKELLIVVIIISHSSSFVVESAGTVFCRLTDWHLVGFNGLTRRLSAQLAV